MKVFITQDGTRFQYTCKGSGTPVVMLHGFTEDGRVWENGIDSLGNKYQLLIPFLPTDDQGSFSPIFLKNPTIEKLASYIEELTTALFESSPVHFIGHSMGGYIGLAYADAYPNKIRSLTLFHSTSFSDAEEKIASRKKSIEFIKNNGTAAFIKQAIPGLFTEKFKNDHPELISEMIVQYSEQTSENLMSYLNAMMNRKDRTEVLQNILPRLIIVGKHDNAVPLTQSLEFIKQSKSTNILLLEESAHMGMFEEPVKTFTFLKQFISAH